MAIVVKEKYFILRDGDFKRAGAFYEQERIDPLNLENIFKGGLYCLLAIAERYERQMRMYRMLLYRGLDNPNSILNDKDGVREALKIGHWPDRKAGLILDFSRNWLDSDLGERLLEDASNRKGINFEEISDSNMERLIEEEFEFRRQIVRGFKGMWYKSASLWMHMMGYKNVVPVDRWVQEGLRLMGFENIRVTDYKEESGLTLSQYLEYERMFSEVARKYGKTPAEFQLAWWCKCSGRGPDHRLKLF